MTCSINSNLCFVNGKEMSVWDVVDSYTGSLKNARKLDSEDE